MKSMDNVVKRATLEAEKLTDTIDKANTERKLSPLIESRKFFVLLLSSQFAKMIMHRVVIEPIKH
jgi:hypothetical protein